MADNEAPEYEIVDPEQAAIDYGFASDDDDDNQEETDGAGDQPAEEVKPPDPEPQKEYVNPNARLRIVEKEKKSLLRTNQELIERMARIEAAILKQNQEPEEEEEPIPELSDDPWGRLDKKIDLVAKEITDKKQKEEGQQAYQAQVENVGQVLQFADQVIHQSKDLLPGYGESNQYLADVLVNHAMELDYIEDEDQAKQEVARWIHEVKIQKIAAGKNPADHFYRMAKYYGWDPNSIKAAEAKEDSTPKPDAREVIKKQREKEKSTRTISNVPGSTAKSSVPFSKRSAEDIQAHFRNQKKTGGKNPYKNDPALVEMAIEIP